MKHKLALESLRKTIRFNVGLNQEDAEKMVTQLKPMVAIIDALQDQVKAIRANGRLSTEGKAADVAKATAMASERIAQHAATISRDPLVKDFAQRVSTRTTGARERARAEAKEASTLALELRQYVLPRLLADGKAMQIPPAQTVGKLVLRAAEDYSTNPAKAEAVISALSVGWPLCPDLPPETTQRINDIIAGQVAPAELAGLKEMQGVQAAIDVATAEILQSVREIG
ncbi:MAG: hypothetical protein JZU50_08365 [Desulfobulbaceae bacterium]|nr:hypothetical protein [Desulfobulbaceae bacterium]